jgi:pyridoxamine 5'-phosphate oxidase family protein
MSVFTDEEIEYLKSQLLGRLATVGSDGQPHVVAVSFRYNAVLDTIDIGGHDFARHKKYRDVQRNPRVALIVDDLQSVNPWRPQGIEVRGEAEVLRRGRGARPRLRSGDVLHPSAADSELGDHGEHDPRRSLYLVAAAPRVSSALSARSCSPYPHQ